ncbi:PTS sugar transporter subunit IIC, partial [Clostridium perfringens]
MTNQEIAQNLVELVGGKDNIQSVANCMTRCRLELKDYSKADIEKIKKLEGSLGVVKADGQLQVIYGPGKVNKVTDEVSKIVGKPILLGEDALKATKAKLKEKNNTGFKNGLRKLGNIFIPLIPLFVACGLVLAVNN